MLKNKKWFSIVFVFFLISLVLWFWVVVMNKQIFFEKKIEYSKIQDVLLKNIITAGNLSMNYDIQNNQDNGTYQPFLSCPEEVSYFSGWVLLSTWSTQYWYQNESCSGSLEWETLNIFYDATKFQFLNGQLGTQWFTFTGLATLSGTLISGNEISFLKPSQLDTRFIKARLENNGIIFKSSGYQNVLWTNKDIRRIINENTNNTGSFSKIWDIINGSIFLDINGWFSWKIIEFNRDFYNNDNKLLKVSEFPFFSAWWDIWYIQQDGTLWDNSTAKIFDFQNKDYAIFISYDTGPLDNIRYQVKVFDNDIWEFAYINPIKDDTDEIEYMGTNILMSDWQYFSKVYKLTDYKVDLMNNFASCSAWGTIPCLSF